MIQVKAPDGSIVQFPDGTTDDVINGVMQKNYGGPEQSNGPVTPHPEFWGVFPEAMDTLTSGLSTKLNAAGGGLMGATANALTGNGWNYSDEYNRQLEQQRADQAAYNSQNPVRSGIGKAAGVALGITSLPVVGSGLSGAVRTGGLYGAIGGAGQDADSLKQRLYNAGVGSASGAATGGILYGIASGIGKLISPNITSPERARLAGVLQNEGVDVTAGQRTGSNGLRYAESELGGARAQDVMERQAEQFTAAALKRAGISSNRATPDVIDNAFTQVGNQFDGVISRNALIPDQQLVGEIHQIASDYASTVGQNNQASIVSDVVGDVANAIQSGDMPGKTYKALRSRIDRVARGTADPELKIALRQLMGSLDDGMERTIAATNPADSGVFGQARKIYRNLIVLEQASTGAGGKADEGLISPSQLRTAVISKHLRRNYARGKGDFAQLARAGEAIMKPLPQSGTAPRAAVHGISAALGSGAGALLGGGIPGASMGALLGAMTGPTLAGRALLSSPVQSYLGNQVMAGRSLGPMANRLIPLLTEYLGYRQKPGLLSAP